MRKMSKLLSLFMVMAMMFMLVPVSALAANDADTTASDKTAVVIATNEVSTDVVTTADTTADTTTDVKTDAATVAEPTVTDKTTVTDPVVNTDKIAETPVTAEKPVTDTLVVDEDTIDTLAASYLCLTQGGALINVLVNNIGADYAYDSTTNELTLNNFVGEELDVISVADTFRLVLLGTNVLKTSNGFAIDVDGSINLSGNGRLTAEGAAIGVTTGGGLYATQDITIDSGYYDFIANGNGLGSAVGIYGGNATSDILINGGYTDVTAVNTGDAGAYGLYSYGDVFVNGGDLDVLTNSTAAASWGIGAFDDIVFNGGYTTVDSSTVTGQARALTATSWVVINNGILDLCTSGGINPLAIEGLEGVYIAPCYGNVDLTASCLYLEPLCSKHFKHHHAASSNPKTGTETTATDAMVAGLALLSLMGLAVVMSKREAKA